MQWCGPFIIICFGLRIEDNCSSTIATFVFTNCLTELITLKFIQVLKLHE